MNRQWMYFSLTSKEKHQKKALAAQFSIKGCAGASVMLSEIKMPQLLGY